jgi:hypothetical protein
MLSPNEKTKAIKRPAGQIGSGGFLGFLRAAAKISPPQG